MSEIIKGRREVAAMQIEQSEHYQAMNTLVKLGVAKKLNDLELYHGRAGSGDSVWKVDSAFDNSGNNTGNRNINKRPAINASNFETAEAFAKSRIDNQNNIAEVHRIISTDPDAVVLDPGVCATLNLSDKITYRAALMKTIILPLEGAPLSFRDRTIPVPKRKDFFGKYALMFENNIDSIAEKTGLRRALVTHIGSAINTEQLIGLGEIGVLCNAFRKNEATITVSTTEDGGQTVPINLEYLASWFRKNHIVGYRVPTDSATLRKRIDNYLLFDLEKVNTNIEAERKRQIRNKRFGSICIGTTEKMKKDHSKIMEILATNLYISPKEIIELAEQTPGFENVFKEDAGNWEKFTLGEHTETVLQFFDDNYADSIPAAMLPIMRMALLTHDIGKSRAVKLGDKKNQEHYNIADARRFMRMNGVNKYTANLIIAMIGQGKDYVFNYIMHKNQSSAEQLNRFCENTIQSYLGISPTDRESVKGFRNMLKILQTCDSAAYTTMSTTRKANGIRYWNSGGHKGNFNASFEPYHGFTGRRARFKRT